MVFLEMRRDSRVTTGISGFPGSSDGKESAYNAKLTGLDGDPGGSLSSQGVSGAERAAWEGIQNEEGQSGRKGGARCKER